ncbi:MAG TPA: hypothetical protein GX503_07485 [Clostridiales bacterium]|nr:hypothetical protein [Clostridiales bacterium]
MSQQLYYTWCTPRPLQKRNFECHVEIANDIDVRQDINNLRGGDGGTGGDGGSPGGDGGDAAATQNTTAAIQNYTIINCGGDLLSGPGSTVTLDADGQKTELKIDEKGDIYVNGQKMDAKDLGDGAKVFVFRNSKRVEK